MQARTWGDQVWPEFVVVMAFCGRGGDEEVATYLSLSCSPVGKETKACSSSVPTRRLVVVNRLTDVALRPDGEEVVFLTLL